MMKSSRSRAKHMETLRDFGGGSCRIMSEVDENYLDPVGCHRCEHAGMSFKHLIVL